MDLDNHRKHSFSNWMRSGIALAMSRSLQCFAGTNGTKKNFQKWKMPKILLQIFSEFAAFPMYIGKAAKVATMHNPDVFMVAIGWRQLNFRCRLSMFEYLRKSSATFWWVFAKVIWIWPEFSCLKVWKTWDKENQNENYEGSTGALL